MPAPEPESEAAISPSPASRHLGVEELLQLRGDLADTGVASSRLRFGAADVPQLLHGRWASGRGSRSMTRASEAVELVAGVAETCRRQEGRLEAERTLADLQEENEELRHALCDLELQRQKDGECAQRQLAEMGSEVRRLRAALGDSEAIRSKEISDAWAAVEAVEAKHQQTLATLRELLSSERQGGARSPPSLAGFLPEGREARGQQTAGGGERRSAARSAEAAAGGAGEKSDDHWPGRRTTGPWGESLESVRRRPVCQ